MDKHIVLIAILHIALATLGLIIAMVVFTAVVGGGVLSGDDEAIAITAIVGTVIAGFIAILSVPSIIGGIGLLKHQPWARILMMIIAALDLFNIPIGTAIGVYTLWVLLQDETIQIFSKPLSEK